MYSLKFFILFIILFFNICFSENNALAWGKKYLLTINENNFSVEDFKNWWTNWKDENTPFPSDLTQFIEWNLLVGEAQKMELDLLPSYQKKVETFLRVRGVFFLKNEEIDSKISISDDELTLYFNKRYNPLWKVVVYAFESEALANEAYEALTNNNIHTAEYLAENNILAENKSYSPFMFKSGDLLYDLLLNAKKGEIIKPLKYNNKYLILLVNTIENRDKDSFHAYKERCIKDLRKQKQAELTNILLNKLKTKFSVSINQNMFDIAHNEAFTSENLNTPIVYTNNGNFLLSSYVVNLLKDKRIKTKQYSNNIELKSIKEKILNDMLFDILIGWEIIDRHYEKTPQLSGIYDFYKRNRLVVEFNKEVFEKGIIINDSDIIEYYNNNLNEFKKPEVVSLAMINVEFNLAEKIFHDIKMGSDFFDTVKNYLRTDLPIEQISLSDLDPKIRSVIDNLANGEVSKPISYNDNYVLIKIINKRLPEFTPIDQVSTAIADKVFQQKTYKIKHDYLTKLKSRSTIKINDEQWKILRKEFGENYDRKEN